jgi:long-chain acyl-CoA synthetase
MTEARRRYARWMTIFPPSEKAELYTPAFHAATAAVDPQVRAEVADAVNHANETVSQAESIREFLILDVDFTEADGYLTPKHSLRRQLILKDFADQVEELYR